MKQDAPGLWLLQSSEGFFQDEVDRAGRVVTSEVLRAERTLLPDWACEALELSAGAPRGSARALALESTGLVALRDRSPTGTTGRRGADEFKSQRIALPAAHKHSELAVSGGRRTLEAIPATPSIARLLEVPTGSPVAYIESVAQDKRLRPFDCYRAWLRTDRTRIEDAGHLRSKERSVSDKPSAHFVVESHFGRALTISRNWSRVP